MSSLTFSVVVCTHNRSRYLPGAVASLRAQTYPAEAYEIIVVDNASSDDTFKVIRQLQAEPGQPIRYIREAEVGLSVARNTGARESRGQIVAYMDDDAVAHPDWLRGLVEPYKSGGADVVCVAGAVHLIWEGKRPSWLPIALESYLSATLHLGDSARPLEPGMHPVGTNFSVRRTQLIELGGFVSVLGRLHSSLLSNEELELCYRIWSHGGLVLYTPKALVHHIVPAARATRRYFLQRGYWQGVSDAILAQLIEPRSRLRLLRSAAANMIFLTQDLLKVAPYQSTGRKNRAFSQLVYSSSRLGRLQQTFRMALSRSWFVERCS